jgi:glucose/mannose-6-phosphate isomerase
LLSFNVLQKIDKKKMYEVYDKWPTISSDSYNYDHEQAGFIGIDHIVFTGMGGSGTIGDMFASILSKTNIHVSVIKGYLLPNTVDSNSLVITTSISGNTIETLSILDSAKKRDCKIIAIASGGKMEEYCNKNNIDFRKIPQFHSPRASFTGFLYSLLKILEPIIPIKENEVKESLSELKKLQLKIHSGNLSDNNPSLNLANWINGIPLIYYPHGLNAAAIRFKNSLQENVKLHSMVEDVIEACHNGIVAWERPSTIQPILLQGEDDFIKTKERWKILKEFFHEKNIDYKDVYSLSGSILTKLICLIYLLDYSTIYRAVLSNIDPSPIDSIDYVKKRL